MGKIKAMAKYRLSGREWAVLLMFSLTVSSIFLLGNFSFLVSSAFEMGGFTASSYNPIVTLVSAVFGVAVFLVFVPALRLGCERWFLLSAKGESVKLREIFYYFTLKGIRKSVSAYMFCFFRKSAAFALFLFPSACLFGVLYFTFSEGEISLYISYALLGFALLLFVTGMFFYFVYTARYFAYYSIIVSNKAIEPQAALDKSRAITEGAYAKICFFRLSFLLWLPVCILLLPAFWVWGYYMESKAMLSYRNDYLRS